MSFLELLRFLGRLGSECAVGWILFSSCTPGTDLVAQGTAPGGPTPPPSISAAVLLEPSPGMIGVPVNLSAITLGFPASVGSGRAAASAISLSAATTGSVPASLGQPVETSCLGRGSGTCVRIPVAAQLLPSLAYTVRLALGVSDDSGHAVTPGVVGQFTTGGVPDLTAPSILAFAVESSGPCLVASFETDEPAAGRVVVRIDGIDREIPAGTGTVSSRFSAAVNLLGSPPGALVQVFARALDLAGNVGESPAVDWGLFDASAPLAITEIHANPAGPEPAQEFVELKNLGTEPVDLGGLTIEDEKGMDALPAVVVPAGEYVLVVASGFDPANDLDTHPAPGTGLVRVDSRLGGDGLSNDGEAVRLRDASGHLVSSYGAAISVSSAIWSGKSIHRVPEDACDQPATWTQRPQPSTPGWGPP